MGNYHHTQTGKGWPKCKSQADTNLVHKLLTHLQAPAAKGKQQNKLLQHNNNLQHYIKAQHITIMIKQRLPLLLLICKPKWMNVELQLQYWQPDSFTNDIRSYQLIGCLLHFDEHQYHHYFILTYLSLLRKLLFIIGFVVCTKFYYCYYSLQYIGIDADSSS